MWYRISVTERGLTGIANIFRSRLSRLDDLLGAGTVPLRSLRYVSTMRPEFSSAMTDIAAHLPCLCERV